MKKIDKLLYGPVDKIMMIFPLRWKSYFFRKIRHTLQGQCHDSDQELEQKTIDFFKKEIALLFWETVLFFVLAVMIICIFCFLPENRVYERNAFGMGEKEIPLILEKDGEMKEYSLELEEQSLSSAELNRLYGQFFKTLEENMRGKNPSLKEVSYILKFDDSLEGYPFEISYEPEDPDYIGWDGTFGTAFDRMDVGESFVTGIIVTAEYGSYCRSTRYEIHLIRKAEKENFFQKTIKSLQKKERKEREENTFQIPKNCGEVKIRTEKKGKTVGMVLLLCGIFLIFLPVHNYMKLKEEEKDCRKETVKDFPVIVHLLTLYMGAGLSFASSIRRISEDYQRRQRKKEKKYAFEEIMRMDRQMRMGVSQKEACISWGKKFQETMYHKLSFTLIQTISKGTREARQLMENTERSAFLQRIDRAKKEGEEATTRLLFPMIVLLILVMILIMFPALMRFQGF